MVENGLAKSDCARNGTWEADSQQYQLEIVEQALCAELQKHMKAVDTCENRRAKALASRYNIMADGIAVALQLLRSSMRDLTKEQ